MLPSLHYDFDACLPSALLTYLSTPREWDEDKRTEFLITELTSKRPLLPPQLPASPEVTEVINTFKVSIKNDHVIATCC